MNQTQIFTKELHLKKFLKKLSPQFYRFIAEKSYWLWIGIGVNVFLISFFVLQVLRLLPEWYRMQNTKNQYVANALLWDNIGNTYHSYQDAYFQSALFAFQGNNLSLAQNEVSKTLFLNPTSIKTQALQRVITFEKERKAGK